MKTKRQIDRLALQIAKIMERQRGKARLQLAGILVTLEQVSDSMTARPRPATAKTR